MIQEVVVKGQKSEQNRGHSFGTWGHPIILLSSEK